MEKHGQKKGKTPKIKVTGNKGGFCVTSAISPAGRMVFRIEKEIIHAEQHIEFLKQIMRQHPFRKIIVIEDNAKPHIAGLVKDFVRENKNRIAVYYLPPYSPDLNPDEKVWKYLKHIKLKAHQARNKKEFKPLVLSKMQSIQKKPELIKSFLLGIFYSNHQNYLYYKRIISSKILRSCINICRIAVPECHK